MKIKTLLPDDYTLDTGGDIQMNHDQDSYELDQAVKEWELSKYTTDELKTELNRRASEKQADIMRGLDNLIKGGKAPF